jgi:ABC-type bacteriocin/lantibiotic exporter with double-glycine peptidase domain
VPRPQILPIASGAQVVSFTRRLLALSRWQLASVIALYAVATAAGLIPPWLLGVIVSDVQHGTTAGQIDVLAAGIAGALIVQSVLTRFGALSGSKLSEGLLASFREEFVAGVLGLPLSVVERPEAATC